MTTGKKKHGPQIGRRLNKTQDFLRSLALRVLKRAEAHNLKRTAEGDSYARQRLQSLAELAEKIAGEMHQPELPLQ